MTIGDRERGAIRLRPPTGFTLIEMSIVLAILSLLYSLAAPVVSRHLKLARETVLKEDLRAMRKALDGYRADHRKPPESLEDLVVKGYIYAVPVDPFTRRADTWVLTEEDGPQGTKGVVGLHSGSDAISVDGEAVSTW